MIVFSNKIVKQSTITADELDTLIENKESFVYITEHGEHDAVRVIRYRAGVAVARHTFYQMKEGAHA